MVQKAETLERRIKYPLKTSGTRNLPELRSRAHCVQLGKITRRKNTRYCSWPKGKTKQKQQPTMNLQAQMSHRGVHLTAKGHTHTENCATLVLSSESMQLVRIAPTCSRPSPSLSYQSTGRRFATNVNKSEMLTNTAAYTTTPHPQTPPK